MAVADFSAPLTRNEHPEEHMVYTFGPSTEAAAAAGGAVVADGSTVHLCVFDRACDIVSITLRAGTAGSAHYIAFYVSASGDDAAGDAVLISTVTDDADGLTADTAKMANLTVSGSPHLNLAAGTLLSMRFEASLATLANLVITVRTKNRSYRTTTAGNKQWDTPNPAI
jgi:hypothetical protein